MTTEPWLPHAGGLCPLVLRSEGGWQALERDAEIARKLSALSASWTMAESAFSPPDSQLEFCGALSGDRHPRQIPCARC